MADKISAYISVPFGILIAAFFVFLPVYLFAPCPGDAEDRLEKYED
jgi:hypothetical protein